VHAHNLSPSWRVTDNDHEDCLNGASQPHRQYIAPEAVHRPRQKKKEKEDPRLSNLIREINIKSRI
jgi:hypothetical protein